MKLRLHPLFLLLLVVLVVLGWNIEILVYFAVVLLHELGHYYIAKKRGYQLNKLYLMPYGVCLSYKEAGFSPNDEIIIAIAGPAVNLLICIITVCLWWIFPSIYDYTYFLCFASFVTFLFNLLPCYPLDGGRVFTAFLSKKASRKLAIRLTLIFNYIFSFLFVAIFIITMFYQINFTYLLIGIFLFAGIIDGKFESKYESLILNTFKSKNLQKGIEIVCMAYSPDAKVSYIYKKLSRKKINYIYVIYDNGKTKIVTENIFNKLLNNFNTDDTINDLLIKNHKK